MGNDFKKAFKNLEKIVKGISSKESLQEIGDEVVSIVKKRTQLGYGVEDSGSDKKKLTPLEPSTVESRKRKQLSGMTAPKKSNLTETGDMLDDIKVTKSSKGELEIGFGSKFSQDKANWNTNPTRHPNKRPFMSLSKVEIKRVTDKIKEIADDLIKNEK